MSISHRVFQVLPGARPLPGRASGPAWPASSARPAAIAVAVVAAVALGSLGSAGCDGDGDGADADAAGQLQWFRTCGDPVCGGYTPTPGATLCTTEAVGDPCAPADATCEIVDDDCNAGLQCATEDPAVNCPISRAVFKRSIRYLDDSDREAYLRAIRAIRLATYNYRWELPDAPSRIGFVIDDQPAGPAVLPGGERVDLYGFTSMAVAALQAQAAHMEDQARRIEALEARLGTLEARAAGPDSTASPAPGAAPLTR